MIRFLIYILYLTGIPRLVYKLMTDSRIPKRLKLIPLFTFLYLILPYDIMPDMFPIFGGLDDVIMIVMGLFAFLLMVPKHIVSEYTSNTKRQSSSSIRADNLKKSKVVEGKYRVKPETEDPDKHDQE